MLAYPMGKWGTQKVGHLNIGAGRIVPQELVRISDAVEEGTIQENEALLNVLPGGEVPQ